jgi:hypothetical protein
MRAEPQTKKTPGTDSELSAGARPVAAGRTKLQRSPLLIVFGLLVLAAGGVFGWFMWVTTSTASEVVAARADVQRGQLITAEDLTTVRVTLDPSLRTVPGANLKSLVGQRAATDLAAGTLISPQQVSDGLLPPQGMSVVAVPVPAGLVPTVPIHAGDTVRLVQTPEPAGSVTGKPLTITAEVVDVTEGDQDTIVNVLVPAASASGLAELAATGRVALVLDSAAR